MAQPRPAQTTAWPMTPAARDALEAEAVRLAADAAGSGAAGHGPGEPIRLPAADARRRLEALRELLADVVVVEEAGIAAIGRTVTLREADGPTWSCTVVGPGDGEPSRGWVSASTPLALAILGRRPGDRVRVHAPGGSWDVVIEDVAEATMLDGCPPTPNDRPTSNARPAPRPLPRP